MKLREWVMVVLAALALSGCATPNYASGPLESLVGAVPGEAVKDERREPGMTKIGPLSVKPEQMFEKWCDERKGSVVPAGNMGAPFNPIVGALHDASMYLIAEGGTGWKPTMRRVTSACVVRQRANEVQAAIMVTQDTVAGVQKSTFYTPGQLEVYGRRAQQAVKQHQEEVNAMTRRNLDRTTAETQRLKAAPKVGDRTRQGLVIEIRGALVLVQHEQRFKDYYGLGAAAWYRTDDLEAP